MGHQRVVPEILKLGTHLVLQELWVLLQLLIKHIAVAQRRKHEIQGDSKEPGDQPQRQALSRNAVSRDKVRRQRLRGKRRQRPVYGIEEISVRDFQNNVHRLIET